jgi:hypothetical protein
MVGGNVGMHATLRPSVVWGWSATIVPLYPPLPVSHTRRTANREGPRVRTSSTLTVLKSSFHRTTKLSPTSRCHYFLTTNK